MSDELLGQVALITGSGRGISRAIAVALAEAVPPLVWSLEAVTKLHTQYGR